MGEVVFLDSSVLFNLLDVPGKNADRAEDVATFKRLAAESATFVLAVTAVIETGNAIAQLDDGRARRACMERFITWLRNSLTVTIPHAVSGVAWDPGFLAALIEGEGERLPLLEYATMGIGSGDASILLEMDRYRAKVPGATPIRLWTRDESLGAHS